MARPTLEQIERVLPRAILQEFLDKAIIDVTPQVFGVEVNYHEYEKLIEIFQTIWVRHH